MRLSEHFDSSEFACKCGCGVDNPSMELVSKLETLRGYARAPLIINSGCRCAEHNIRVGGSPNSQHRLCKAADVRCPKGLTIDRFAELAERVGFGGIGKYDTFIHVDVRDGKSRWDYRKAK